LRSAKQQTYDAVAADYQRGRRAEAGDPGSFTCPASIIYFAFIFQFVGGKATVRMIAEGLGEFNLEATLKGPI